MASLHKGVVRIVRLKTHLEYHNKSVKVYYDKVRFPDGREDRYNRLVEGTTGEGVVVLPIRSDGKIGLIRIYRYPVSSRMWELPRGLRERKATPQQDAKRELEEETGLKTKRIRRLGVIYPNTGLLSTRVHVFAVYLRESSGPSRVKRGEGIEETRYFDVSEIKKMTSRGSISDAFTLSALQLALSKGVLD